MTLLINFCLIQARKKGTAMWSESSKGKDKFLWLLCANRQTHVPEQLLLTQIIPSDCLNQIDKKLHECRSEWGIRKYCSCSAENKPVNEELRCLIKGGLEGVMNGKKDSPSNESSQSNGEVESCNLNWLAEVALNRNKNDSDSDSDSDDDHDGNHSTLRELLIRPSQKNGSGPDSPDCDDQEEGQKAAKKVKRGDTLSEVITSVIEHSVKVS